MNRAKLGILAASCDEARLRRSAMDSSSKQLATDRPSLGGRRAGDLEDARRKEEVARSAGKERLPLELGRWWWRRMLAVVALK